MPRRILSLQSHVVFGHVGNSAAVFPLQRLGCEVLPVHTVQFSSHAGYPGWRGRAFEAGAIDDLVEGLKAVGALARCDAVLTGYLGRPEIGEAALRALDAVRASAPEAIYACDPVIGDVGRGIYVGAGVPEFFAARALPRADILTPNAFELGCLAGRDIGDIGDARAALAHLHALGPKAILVTSLNLDDTPADALDMIASDGADLWRLRTPRLKIEVNGAGDLLSALFLYHWLQTRAAPQALASAAASVYGVVAATAAAGTRELALIGAQEEFVRPTHRFRAEQL